MPIVVKRRRRERKKHVDGKYNDQTKLKMLLFIQLSRAYQSPFHNYLNSEFVAERIWQIENYP